jgi:hypothetical protein
MTLWEYKVETVRGIFWLRSRKLPEVRRICTEVGDEGWELVGISYDWFVVQYVLYFKRPKRT